MKRLKTVDDYVDAVGHWPNELKALREILRATKLVETIKWGAPCYVHNGKNVVGLGAFKSYVGLWFHQGALLSDPEKVLINAQEGKTKALRQWRFQSTEEIDRRKINSYIAEAIALQEQGEEIKPVRNNKLLVPKLLRDALSRSKNADVKFKSLIGSKQREYVEFIAEAKREDTKIRRLEKILPMIIAGKGLNDKYRT